MPNYGPALFVTTWKVAQVRVLCPCLVFHSNHGFLCACSARAWVADANSTLGLREAFREHSMLAFTFRAAAQHLLHLHWCKQWRTQELSKVQGIALRGACLLMGDGRHRLVTGFYGAFFVCRVAQQGFWGSCWLRVDLRFRQMRSCLRTFHTGWTPRAKGTAHALNARMLGTPLGASSVRLDFCAQANAIC